MDESLFNKYAAQTATASDSMGLPAELAHGAVAALVDVGTTTWNSLTPASMEVSTEDLLSRIDSSALQVYSEHTDAVKAASFIGGMVLPVGIAVKGMNLLRAGSKGVGILSDAGRVSRLKEVEDAFATGGAGINEALKAAQLRYYTGNALNQVADMAAAEVAITIAMSSHPYMEDYYKDFGQNFVMNLALGSTLGAGIGHIIARGEVAGAKMAVEKELTTTLKEIVKAPDVTENYGAMLMRRQQNVDEIDAKVIAAESGKIVLTNHTVESLKLISQSEQAKIFTIADDFLHGELATAGQEAKKFVLDTIIKDSRFVEAEKVGWVSISKDLGKAAEDYTISLAEKPTLMQKVVNKVTGKETLKKADAVYLPWANEGKGAFASLSEAKHVLSIADTGLTVELLTKEIDKGIGYVARKGLLQEMETLPTHLIEKEFARSLLSVIDRPIEDFQKSFFKAASMDLPALKAFQSTISKFKNEGKSVEGIEFTLYGKGLGVATAKSTAYAGPKFATIRSMDEYRHLVESSAGERIGVYPSVEQAQKIADNFEKIWMKEHLKELKKAPTSNPSEVAGKEGSITYKANEIDQIVEVTTRQQVRELSLQGAGRETISLRTSTPLEAVDKILAGESLHGVGMSKFTSATEIETALLSSNRALSIATNPNKKLLSSVHAAMNKRQMDTAANHNITAFLQSSPSEFVRGTIAPQLLSDEAKIQIRALEQEVESLLTTGLGSTLTRSADSVVSRLGAAGVYLTTAGKRLIDVKNMAREQFTKPLSEALARVAKNDAHTIEFNTAIEVLNAQSGMKFYRAGQFWQQEASALGFKEVMAMEDDVFLAWANTASKEDATKVMAKAIKFKGADYKVVTPVVDAALHQLQSAGREMYELGTVSHKIVGRGAMGDIGFWIPATNPTGKQIAYVFNQMTGDTTLILGKTPAELNSRIKEFEDSLGVDKNLYKVITKGKDQADYNKIAGRHDEMYMSIADSSKLHGGASARASVTTNTELMADIIQGYDYQIGKNIDRIAQIQYAPIIEHLDNLSAISMKGYSPNALNALQKATTQPVDPGLAMRNMLLGRSNLSQHEGWMNFQSNFQAIADRGLRNISEIFSPIIGKQHRTAEDWKEVVAQMEKEGIVNPFQTVEDFISAEGKQGIRSVVNLKAGETAYIREGNLAGGASSSRLIALSNGVAATTVLRMAELAQPLVNMLSLPILTSAAVNKRMAASFMGATLDPSAKFAVTSAMYDGFRFAGNKTLSTPFEELAVEAGLFKDDWRVVNGIMKEIKNFEPGITSKAESILESRLVEHLSWAADKSETVVRRMSYFTGVALAKKAYPGLPDAGVFTFARNFMNEAVGNYAAAQRPAVFQGTVGVAMGLFQTYMLTMAQHIYGQVEGRNWKALSKMMLTQNTIFGTASLPGFHPISEYIGEHFSDQHYDLQTGTIRAVGDETAELMLYGMPSQLVGINTRGDIQPRIPNLTDFSTLAAVNFTKQAYNALERVTQAAFTADKNTGVAMLEALSLQSLSRPVARVSELMMGKSITSSGDIVMQGNELYTVHGLLSRGFATRPIEEIKARETFHLNTLYGAGDRDNRKAVSFRLKSYIESGNLSDEQYAQLNEEYMRTGTPTGWRSAVRDATQMAGQPGSMTVRDKLKPDSPLNLLVEDMD